jgi:hypothetical protein
MGTANGSGGETLKAFAGSKSEHSRKAWNSLTKEFVIQERVSAWVFAMLRSLFFKGSSEQLDSRSVSLNCVVLQPKIVEA